MVQSHGNHAFTNAAIDDRSPNFTFTTNAKTTEFTGHSLTPQLEMPNFSGDKMKWTEFWDTFKTTIDQNESLSDIEKMKYLNSKLTGEAKQAESGILLSNENYRVVIDLLKERFGDKQL